MSDNEQGPPRATFERRVRSPHTLETYQTGMASYEAFCELHGFTAHPAQVDVVCRWVRHLYTVPGNHNRPTSPDTVKTYLSGIKLHQRQRHDEDPTWPLLDSERLRDELAAYRWQYAQDGHAPPEIERFTAGHLLALLGWFDRGVLRGRRDAALLSVLYGATARRDEVAQLQVDDCVPDSEGGVRVWFARTGRGAYVEPNPADEWLCPARALRDWLADLRANGVATGPVAGQMGTRADTWPAEWRPMTSEGVAALVTRACRKARLGHHSPESVRAGSAKDVAAATEGDVLAVADAGGWAWSDSARRHVDEEERRVHRQVLGGVLARAQPLEPVAGDE